MDCKVSISQSYHKFDNLGYFSKSLNMTQRLSQRLSTVVCFLKDLRSPLSSDLKNISLRLEQRSFLGINQLFPPKNFYKQ